MDVAALMSMQPIGGRTIGKQTWENNVGKHLLIRPDGRFAVYSGVAETQAQNSPSRLANKPYVFASIIQIDSKPEVYQEALPWRGQTAYLSNLRLVKLPQDAAFPSTGDFLDLHFLDVLGPGFGDKHSLQTIYYVQTEREGPKENPQVWPIELTFRDDLSRLMALVKEFSQFPPAYVALAFDEFSPYDRDKNKEVADEEYTLLLDSISRQRRLRNALASETPPVLFETFLKLYIENEGDQ